MNTILSWANVHQLGGKTTTAKSSAATYYLTTRARQHLCALLMMMPSIFGTEQRISEPLSALAVLTGRHTE